MTLSPDAQSSTHCDGSPSRPARPICSKGSDLQPPQGQECEAGHARLDAGKRFDAEQSAIAVFVVGVRLPDIIGASASSFSVLATAMQHRVSGWSSHGNKHRWRGERSAVPVSENSIIIKNFYEQERFSRDSCRDAAPAGSSSPGRRAPHSGRRAADWTCRCPFQTRTLPPPADRNTSYRGPFLRMNCEWTRVDMITSSAPGPPG